LTWTLIIVLVLLIAVIALLGWRYFNLRRRLASFARTIRRTAENSLSLADLPEDEKGLEGLSNAVKTLVMAEQDRSAHLDAERTRLAAVLEQMTDGVLIADAEGRIQFTNPAAEKLFEAPAALGHTVAEVIRQHQLVQAWRLSRETGETQEESVELPARRLFLQLVVLPDKVTGGSLLLVQNLTRVRRLETVRRDFISNVSHELRTPLASLKALTETLQEGALEDPTAAHRFLGRIETEVDALTQMATELLELTRIESGQVPLDRKAMAPSKLLNSSADRMRAQAERAGLILRVEVPNRIPMIQADPSRLEQVLVNLIHNAIKFTRPGGVVELSTSVEGEFVRFTVRDNGAGIPEDDLERIFERFYKADHARSGGGTGLGLSIARHIVEAHGGKIWAESAEGRGSTFFFIVPASTLKK
jgi:two-component system phosphate regulon sensor histidine kinase PhoR